MCAWQRRAVFYLERDIRHHSKGSISPVEDSGKPSSYHPDCTNEKQVRLSTNLVCRRVLVSYDRHLLQ